MKISKLFHWLYAFLMFLPIFAIFVQCGYVIFNKNAYESYTGYYTYSQTLSINELKTANEIQPTEITINSNTYYEWINSNFYNQLRGYYLTNNTAPNISYTIAFEVNNLILNNRTYNNALFLTLSNKWGEMQWSIYNTQFNKDLHYLKYNNGLFKMYNIVDNTEVPISEYDHTNNLQPIELDFYSTNTSVYTGSSNGLVFNYTFLNANIFKVDTNLSSVFYSSLQALDNVEFFSWAKDSFIAEPFLYIGNLFGIESTHPIFTFLSYWTAISVIYLVFDLVMYVPLLVHRWIDKGIIE